MTEFAVSPNVLKRMHQYSPRDEPATPEMYLPDPDNWHYSLTISKTGRHYEYIRSTNEIIVTDADSRIEAGAGFDPDPVVPPLVIKQVPVVNYTPGRAGAQPTVLVLHTMGGFLKGSDSWFNNPASQVSAHFGVGVDGEVHQYVRLTDTAWANGILEIGNNWPGPAGNPNRFTVSVETEDLNNASTPVSDAQYQATLAVCRHVLRECPTIRTLIQHKNISPRTRPNCPGPRWVASGKYRQLAIDLGIQFL